MSVLECPICGSKANGPSIGYLDRTSPFISSADTIFTNLNIHTCADCGFGWALPYVSENDFLRYYKGLYRKDGSLFSQIEPINKFSGYHFDTRSASQILLGMTFREFKAGDSFLDIGCGDGYALWTIKNLLPEMKYFAIEPDKRCYPSLERLGVTILGESLRLVKDRRFDFILMSHLLEHYNGADIITMLGLVKSMLSDDGLFILEVPLCDIIRHKDMRYNDAPHLSFFTEESLRRAITRAGLTIKFLNGCGQRYSDWWNEAQQTSYPCLPNHSSIRSALRMAYRFSPLFVKNIYERLRMPASLEHISSDDFKYGKDRTCIRAVCALKTE